MEEVEGSSPGCVKLSVEIGHLPLFQAESGEVANSLTCKNSVYVCVSGGRVGGKPSGAQDNSLAAVLYWW